MSVGVLDLPPEVLSHVVSFLPGACLPAISLVCRTFRDAVKVDSVWQTRCQQDFNINVGSSESSEELSCHQIYTKLLFPYGFCLGLWKMHRGCYGGLMHIQFEEVRIIARELLPPPDPHIDQPLRDKTLFTIEIDKDGSTSCLCHKGYHGTHEFELLKEDGDICYKCGRQDIHKHPNGKHAEFLEWLHIQTDNSLQDFVVNQELLLEKFLIFLQFETCLHCSPLLLPPTPQECVPIQPGLFKGTYGAHGVELVLLSYDMDKHQAVCHKISGDPNIPANYVSVIADLRRPMILAANQQSTMGTLAEIDTPDLPPEVTVDKLPHQPFCVPANCFDRYKNPPRMCKARFHSKGQIASADYTDPSFCLGHWVVFDEHSFGHIWLELRSLSVYCRVKQNFS